MTEKKKRKKAEVLKQTLAIANLAAVKRTAYVSRFVNDKICSARS